MSYIQNIQLVLTKTLAVVLLFLFAYVIFRSVYNVFLHPLRRVPGPFLAKISRLWLFYHDYQGTPHSHIRELHQKFGPLVRISPNEVSIDDVDANNTIYAQNKPWVKPAYHYKAFQSSVAYSVFTELDPPTHTAHSRLLAPAFAQSRVNAMDAQRLVWDKCNIMVEGMRKTLGSEPKHDSTPYQATTMSLTRLFRSFALDIVTTWTFGHCAESLSNFHSDLFDVFDVAAESVIYFQHIPFLRALIPYIAPLVPSLVPNKILGQYAKKALEANRAAFNGLREVVPCVFSELVSSQWQEKRGYTLSDEQIISDGIVILAAGADTTAAALSIGMHWLVRSPDLWQQLQDELHPVMSTSEMPRIGSLAMLPLLNAVLKEGLRVSCPIRGHMPRVVPSQGWNYKGTHFPPGAVVATSPFYGCYNETVFEDPELYDPTRWLPPRHTPKMEAYLQPFSRGTRQCIGQNLTLAMQRVAIANVVYHFQPITINKSDIQTREFVTLLIDSPLEVTLRPLNRMVSY
ncbi:cytochrome P450 4A10 [Colletotrichum navitas]|uniref:Cytochrome P450 4A10 n=1 Tax=Colletotrichum navitas TaxID=681940 RepID=A0AAD8PI15_9PEZI|nr:cytochrome P450 4A10 [Colletotrichum navitas]KAK1561471.1 cytochrome P450 4A10 [Colletotrichum navitas]